LIFISKTIFNFLLTDNTLWQEEYVVITINDLLFFKINTFNGNILKKIRFLWGLFTPIERTQFINTYILDDF